MDNLGENHCNPLSFYAGTGLGKTHLLHAIGNELVKRTPGTRVLYIHLERFYRDIIKAINSSITMRKKSKILPLAWCVNDWRYSISCQ